MINAEYQRGCEEFAAQHWHSWDAISAIARARQIRMIWRDGLPLVSATWSVPLSDNPNLQFHLENRCYRAW
jgi:hypothetical protein